MLRRSTVGLMASGGVLFLTGAIGLTATWTLMTGTLLLTGASVLLAITLEEPDLQPWVPDGSPRAVNPLERAV